MPIMYVNLSGDYDGIKLKEYAENCRIVSSLYLSYPCRNRGRSEREIQINVDPLKWKGHAQL